jgi:hypothetical protein
MQRLQPTIADVVKSSVELDKQFQSGEINLSVSAGPDTDLFPLAGLKANSSAELRWIDGNTPAAPKI